MFSGNDTSGDGGTDGGAIVSKNGARTRLADCVIEANTAGGRGGGVFGGEAPPTCDEGCSSPSLAETTLVLYNCLIVGNSATDDGGGVFAYDDSEIG